MSSWAPPVSDYRHRQPCLTMMWIPEIQTQVFMLAEQTLSILIFLYFPFYLISISPHLISNLENLHCLGFPSEHRLTWSWVSTCLRLLNAVVILIFLPVFLFILTLILIIPLSIYLSIFYFSMTAIFNYTLFRITSHEKHRLL